MGASRSSNGAFIDRENVVHAPSRRSCTRNAIKDRDRARRVRNMFDFTVSEFLLSMIPGSAVPRFVSGYQRDLIRTCWLSLGMWSSTSKDTWMKIEPLVWFIFVGEGHEASSFFYLAYDKSIRDMKWFIEPWIYFAALESPSQRKLSCAAKLSSHLLGGIGIALLLAPNREIFWKDFKSFIFLRIQGLRAYCINRSEEWECLKSSIYSSRCVVQLRVGHVQLGECSRPKGQRGSGVRSCTVNWI